MMNIRPQLMAALLPLFLGGCSDGDTPKNRSNNGGGSGGTTSGGGGNGGANGGTVSATVSVSAATPIPVAATFFGQNYWSWVPDWGDPVAAVVDQTTELKLGLLRAGGANNDRQDPARFTNEEVDGFVDFARRVGAEPLLQVPLLRNLAGEPATAQDAADLVTYVNVTRSHGVKYFSIGNEPDLYEEQNDKPAGYTASAYCTTFREFATAMRAVDATIKILGPELSWKYQSGSNDWLTPFLEECGDVTDVIAIHRYPFAPEASKAESAYADAKTYRALLTRIRGIMAATGQQDKPLAVTEANITWNGDPSNAPVSAAPGTFPAALWLADNLGVSLEAGLFSVNYWSLSEGWTLGFFDVATPRPAFHVLKMFSNNFGSEVLTVSGAPDGTSLYAGRNSSLSTTNVYVVNKTKNTLDLTISFTDHPRSAPVTMNVYPTSLHLAVVPDDGSPPTFTSYAEGTSAPMPVAP